MPAAWWTPSRQPDLDGFARQVLTAAGEGKRFLFRSAASLLTALAALPPSRWRAAGDVPLRARRAQRRGADGLPRGHLVTAARPPGPAQRCASRPDRPGSPDRGRGPAACGHPGAGGGRPAGRPRRRPLHQPGRAPVPEQGGAAGLRRAGLGLPGEDRPQPAGGHRLPHQQGRHYVQRHPEQGAGAAHRPGPGTGPPRLLGGPLSVGITPASPTCRWSYSRATWGARRPWPRSTASCPGPGQGLPAGQRDAA